jgi:8-oxoguanine deaminase
MSAFLIRNPLAILNGRDEGESRSTGSVRVQDGVITEVGDVSPQAGDEIIDAGGCVLYPGLVNTHHHLFQSALKGVAAGLDQPLYPWLEAVPYRYGPLLREEDIATAAEIGLVELMLSGCTTVADHHYLFGQEMGYDPAELLFETASRLGVRFVLLRGGATRTRTFATDKRPAMPTQPVELFLREVESTVRRFHDPSGAALRKVVMAPTTPFYSTSPQELREMAQVARSLGIRLHSHLSETADYVTYAREVLQTKPLLWCAEQGWIGPDVSFAHMVHLDAQEIALCGSTGTAIAHCPQSNGRLGSGVAPVQALAAAGSPISIGVDGAASNEAADMVSELHAAWLIHRAAKGAGAQSADRLVHWASAGGAQVLGLDEVGVIAPGMQADLVLFDLTHPRYCGNHDPASAPVTAGGAPWVRRSWVAGREVVRDGAIAGVDWAQLALRSAKMVQRLQSIGGL